MRATVTTIVTAACLVVSAIGIANATPPTSKEMVLVGKVTSLKPGGGNELKRWIVTVKVDKVVSGDFSGPTFQFAVHSPSQSGLEKGRSYTIEAVWDGTGYTVDELQWTRKRTGARNRTVRLANKSLQAADHLGRFAPSVARR
jgi:hypothetical protein